jgi:outer membrane protein OmpA-like peptidoglycan-associated protein
MRLVILLALCGIALADKPAPIHVTYDADHLDLGKHVLQVKLSRKADAAELSVLGEDGKEIGKGSVDHLDANTWIKIPWTQPDGAKVLKLELRVSAADGVATNVELVPWSVTVDHEDVNFATDSAKIEDGEAAKLDASLAKIDDIVKRVGGNLELRLYIAGHTDTVGSPDKNRTLSLARAKAIAKYFRDKKLAISIAVAGYGQDVLKVQTPAQTDERANRRADYVIGPAKGAPPFGGPYLKAKAEWKNVP